LLGTGLAAAPASAATAHSTRTSIDEWTYEHTEGARTGRFKCGTVIYKYTRPDYGYLPYNGRKEAFGADGDGIVCHACRLTRTTRTGTAGGRRAVTTSLGESKPREAPH
jgi:hypothetical protein